MRWYKDCDFLVGVLGEGTLGFWGTSGSSSDSSRPILVVFNDGQSILSRISRAMFSLIYKKNSPFAMNTLLFHAVNFLTWVSCSLDKVFKQKLPTIEACYLNPILKVLNMFRKIVLEILSFESTLE